MSETKPQSAVATDNRVDPIEGPVFAHLRRDDPEDPLGHNEALHQLPEGNRLSSLGPPLSIPFDQREGRQRRLLRDGPRHQDEDPLEGAQDGCRQAHSDRQLQGCVTGCDASRQLHNIWERHTEAEQTQHYQLHEGRETGHARRGT